MNFFQRHQKLKKKFWGGREGGGALWLVNFLFKEPNFKKRNYLFLFLGGRGAGGRGLEEVIFFFDKGTKSKKNLFFFFFGGGGGEGGLGASGRLE